MVSEPKFTEWAVQVPDAQGGTMYIGAPNGEQDAYAIADLYVGQNPVVVTREVSVWKKKPAKKPAKE
jgi:hypothetical protein